MKNKRRYFTVTGSGQFPYDMLRYDACWPASEAETPHMAVDWGGNMRSLTLATDNPNAPTYGRWSSFTWTASDVRQHKDGEW